VMTDEVSNSGSNKWVVCCQEVPSREVIFFTQVFILYITICVSLVNLTLGIGNQTLWTSLLSGSFGYLLPSPNIGNKKRNDTFLSNAP
jgi:hypothetical protein